MISRFVRTGFAAAALIAGAACLSAFSPAPARAANVPDVLPSHAELDIPAMREIAVQMVVGAADVETWEITHRQGGKHWMPGANDAGATRPERLDALRKSFEANGIKVRFDLIPNMAHEGPRAISRVEDFFATTLAARRAKA